MQDVDLSDSRQYSLLIENDRGNARFGVELAVKSKRQTVIMILFSLTWSWNAVLFLIQVAMYDDFPYQYVSR